VLRSARPTLTGICGPWPGWVSLSALAKPLEPEADVLPPAVFRTVAAGPWGRRVSTFHLRANRLQLPGVPGSALLTPAMLTFYKEIQGLEGRNLTRRRFWRQNLPPGALDGRTPTRRDSGLLRSHVHILLI